MSTYGFVSWSAWEVYAEYVDWGISGSKESRPELNRLMSNVHLRRSDVCFAGKWTDSGSRSSTSSTSLPMSIRTVWPSSACISAFPRVRCRLYSCGSARRDLRSPRVRCGWARGFGVSPKVLPSRRTWLASHSKTLTRQHRSPVGATRPPGS